MSAATHAARGTLLLVAALGAGCEREERRFRETPPTSGPSTPVTMNDQVQPGPMLVDPATGDPRAHRADSAALVAGRTLYTSLHCADCHAPGGGGGMGPPLIDSLWIYGSEPENVFRTIVEGRPHGMPAYRDRVPEPQLWALVAYVRALSGVAGPASEPRGTDSTRLVTPLGAVPTPRAPAPSLIPPEQLPPPPPPSAPRPPEPPPGRRP